LYKYPAELSSGSDRISMISSTCSLCKGRETAPLKKESYVAKILIFGSTDLLKSFDVRAIKEKLELEGKEVKMPYLDSDMRDLGIKRGIEGNKKLIEWCDKGLLYWDGRSQGSLIDIGMFIALGKPYEIGYIEKNITLANLIKAFCID